MADTEQLRTKTAFDIMSMAAIESGNSPVDRNNKGNFLSGASYLAREHNYPISSTWEADRLDPSVAYGRKAGYLTYLTLKKIGMEDQLSTVQLADRAVATATMFIEPPKPFDRKMAAHGVIDAIVAEAAKEL